MTIEFTAPDLSFAVDERKVAQLACEAITETVRENLQAGLAPDGSPMPDASLATVIRREYRTEQQARGKQPSPRYKDPKFRARAVKNWNRRFIAARLGEFYPAARAGRTVGTESGMLAASPKAVPSVDGNGWTMWFAATRARTDSKGSSAVQRVFGPRPIWSEAAMRQPRIQEALRQVAGGLVASRTQKLLNELVRTARLTKDLAEDVGDTGEPT